MKHIRNETEFEVFFRIKKIDSTSWKPSIGIYSDWAKYIWIGMHGVYFSVGFRKWPINDGRSWGWRFPIIKVD